MDPNQPMYWGERWELFKHTYVVAGWCGGALIFRALIA
jgi:hypothetical protein